MVHELSEAARMLAGWGGEFVLTSHRSPDGDAVGSEVALAGLLKRMGRKVRVVNRDPAPPGIRELPGAEQIELSAFVDGDPSETLLVVLECPSLQRCGLEDASRYRVLNLDHHMDNQLFGEVNVVDSEAPAVGEMVWKLFRELGVSPGRREAEAAYLALATDTGDFRYPNTNVRAFRAAAEMVEAGARPWFVSELVHERNSREHICLMGRVLSTLELHEEGRIALVWADAEAFAACSAGPEDAEEIVSVPRSIAGVRLVAFLKEWEKGRVRVSFRSKGEFDVKVVAAKFGGGGHLNAAGCTIEADLPTAREMVLRELKLLLEAGNAERVAFGQQG